LKALSDAALAAHRAPTMASFACITVDEQAKEVRIAPGSWTIDRDLVIPAGYRVLAVAPLKLALVQGAQVISRSALRWTGSEEMPILITSPDSSSQGVHVLDVRERSELKHVRFTTLGRAANEGADVSFHASNVWMDHVRFSGADNTLLDVALGEA